jgi:3-isopropylmalate/(R)-2-methylmalate dehydratase small subunit
VEPFVNLTGVVAPIDRVNVDTDQIIPAVYLKRIERTGYGEFLFTPWRYREDGSPNPDFVLNQPAYSSATVIVSGRNFGSGSSREHAPWALHDYGIRCVIAPSFADIFYNNCFQNGLLPIILPEETVREILDRSKNEPGYQINVDLELQRIWDNNEDFTASFDIDPFRRHALMNGLDDIGLTLENEDKIAAFEGQISGS